jgi:hypothetical protein
MRTFLALVLLAAPSVGCQELHCADGGTIHIGFGGAHIPQYSAVLTVAGHQLHLACPQNVTTGEGWEVVCVPEGIMVRGTGFDIHDVSQAVLTVTAADGQMAAKDLLVPLGEAAREPGGLNTCERDADARLMFGIAEGFLKLTPPSSDFGAVPIGAASPPFPFTLTNAGSGPSGTLQPAVQGDFAIDEMDCPDPLGPDRSCIVNIVFRPTAVGQRPGTLTIAATPGGTVSASLTGQGLPGELPDAGPD